MLRKMKVEASAWFLLALLILTLPLQWVVSAILAAAFHELCHLGILRLSSVSVHGLKIRAGGALLETGPVTAKEELLCALAGPLGSFLLLGLVHHFPRISLCALVQGCYNLIPLGNLDGARVLRSAIRLLPGKSPCKEGKMRVQ